MTPEEMDEHAQSEGRTFYSAGKDGSRIYSRPHIDGVRLSLLILHPDGRSEYAKAFPVSAPQPPPSASPFVLFHKIEPPSAATAPSPAPYRHPSAPRRLVSPMNGWEKFKTWLSILFVGLPMGLGGLVGCIFGLHMAFTDWKTVTSGTFAAHWATPTKSVTRSGSTTTYGTIHLPGGHTVETEMDSTSRYFATSSTVRGWHLGANFVRDKNSGQWLWHGGCFIFLLFGTGIILIGSLTGIRDLVRGT